MDKQIDFKLAKTACGMYGFTLTRKSQGFKQYEYRLAPILGTPAERENKAYYTNDLSDAIGTARLEASKANKV